MSDNDQAAAPRPIAVCRSYDDLRRAIAARCDDILMTREQLEAKAGLANGHSGKLLSPRAISKFGDVSLGLVLAATGLVLIVAEDSEALDRIRRQRDASHTHASQRRPGKRPRRSATGDQTLSQRAQRQRTQGRASALAAPKRDRNGLKNARTVTYAHRRNPTVPLAERQGVDI